jgi:DNA repair and recombination protein RAD54B
VLIISYDMLRRHGSKLAKCSDCHLVVCDEAHKLKNIQGNQTIDALNAMPARLRILLSGTPVQNDLQEFYALMNIVSPGLLGAPKMFQVQIPQVPALAVIFQRSSLS